MSAHYLFLTKPRSKNKKTLRHAYEIDSDTPDKMLIRRDVTVENWSDHKLISTG